MFRRVVHGVTISCRSCRPPEYWLEQTTVHRLAKLLQAAAEVSSSPRNVGEEGGAEARIARCSLVGRSSKPLQQVHAAGAAQPPCPAPFRPRGASDITAASAPEEPPHDKDLPRCRHSRRWDRQGGGSRGRPCAGAGGQEAR